MVIDTSNPKDIVEFIYNTPTGTYEYEVENEGREVVVEVKQGRFMYIKYLNDEGWYECVEYDHCGLYQCDWVEKKKEEVR